MRAMKHRFFDVNQVAFWDGQEPENLFKVTCEPMIHHFLDLTQVAFWVLQQEENDFQVPGYH